MTTAIKGKKIILGVCAGIAAYKAAFLIRLLVKKGADVQVIMTPSAKDFISPLTLSTLSGKPVLSTYLDEKQGTWNNHVELALWADLILIAPATANTMAKFASGLCDNLLLAVYLSARSPVCIAPAMDLDMWQHPATKANLTTLRSFGHQLIMPGHGELASGLVGEGRLAEPEEIVGFLSDFFSKQGQLDVEHDQGRQDLTGKKVLVTAGPTREAIDPVRYISNHSSGKMGVALAWELANRGAEVHLIHGPVSISLPQHPLISLEQVISASEMYEACILASSAADLIVMAAAVADYTPIEPALEKIKKQESDLFIPLTKTNDILAELGQRKKEGQVLVGFALETEREEEHARAKLERKKLDMIVLNSLRDPGAGFGTDTNKVTVFHKEGASVSFDLSSKTETAHLIVNELLKHLKNAKH